jgi:hypothetical protein
MSKQSHTFVMSTEVVGSAWDMENNMKLVEKPEQKVWKDKESGKMKQSKENPFEKGTLVAGMGDPIPEGVTKKAAKKAETKAVKPEENK